MSITVVSRWKAPQESQALARQAGPIIRRHGASMVRLGFCYSGAFAGQFIVVADYENWETYGSGMKAMVEDPEYKGLVAEAMAKYELVDRGIVISEEI